MGKNSKKRRRAQREGQRGKQADGGGATEPRSAERIAAKALGGGFNHKKSGAPPAAAPAPRTAGAADPSSAAASPEEMLITIETLEALSSHVSAASSTTDKNRESSALAAAEDDDPRPDLTELLDRPPYRDLRRALRPFFAARDRRSYDPRYRANRITAALKSGRWNDALRGLDGLDGGGSGGGRGGNNSSSNSNNGAAVKIKRGTVQRWVRFCDDCDDAGLRARILHAALNCSPRDNEDEQNDDEDNEDESGGGGGGEGRGGGGPRDLNKHDPRRALKELEEGTRSREEASDDDDEDNNSDDEDNNSDDGEMRVVRTTEWTVPNKAEADETSGKEDDDSTPPSSLPPEEIERLDGIDVRTIHRIPAAERKPPNRHDLNIYATPPGSIVMGDGSSAEAGTSSPPPPAARRHDVEAVPGGAFLLSDVLTPSECLQILHVAESKRMGYVPDHPVSRPSPTGIDTLEWLVDASILDPLHSRVLPLVAAHVKGEEAMGINARWRLFRYGPDSVYRPHIDGSWTGAGIDRKTGKYISDVHDGEQRSRFTFLIYLNDMFEGGGTTFYLPCKDNDDDDGGGGSGSGSGSGGGFGDKKKKKRKTSPDGGGKGKKRGGGFETVVVKPRRGAALCFPQGNTASLLHEGSRVTGGGVPKYVVRTDVLYRVKKKKKKTK